jgi:transcription-repair coupling factor (superfamily II helicase)
MASSDPLHAAGEILTPGARDPMPPRVATQAPAAALAVALACASAGSPLVHLASSERRAEEIGRALAGLFPDREVLVLPPWDCLPYDRASPSRDVMGRRMRVLAALAKIKDPLLVTSPEALVQRLPPHALALETRLSLAIGQRLDREAFIAFARRTGYVFDERIDEPGEIAVLGEVVDLFPAEAAQPVRIQLNAQDEILEMRLFDPLTQRSEARIEALDLGPASEWIETREAERAPGLEHDLPSLYPRLESLFEILPHARLSVDAAALGRISDVQEHIADAFEARRLLGGGDSQTPPPDRLYCLGDALSSSLAQWTAVSLDLAPISPAPIFARARNPGRAFSDFVAAERAAGRTVVLTGLAHELRPLARALSRGLGAKPEPAADWTAAIGQQAILTLEADLDAGFVDPAQGVSVIAASDVLGGRMAARRDQTLDLTAEPDLRIGDVVLHEDHGLGILRALSTVEIDGDERDVLHLEYKGGDTILAPIEEIGRIWRYGAEAAGVTLDRLKGEAWTRRRAEVARHVEEAARKLVSLAAARAERRCEPIVPPKATYARFAARFAYPETPDQSAAIEAVLDDLASGRPMDRLVCGDVGYGKTEVALRAAAAVALSGRQVALAAPTTVLARQHVETFKRRFAGSDVGVAHLSRLVSAAEARAVKAGLASGEIRIVIGTHALGSQDLTFDNLALMIIDEEQKFGAALKETLRAKAQDGHVLTLTATPIPRTLQAAMVGIQAVSVIASPPARRRPIRTFLSPFDAASLRMALLREKRRGGQSFVVVPRIEDIAPMAERLASLAPELSLKVAHGDLPTDETDMVMIDFADGGGDVLLATNIIESGLDVPRANTMIIWRPDRFGLSQLHQLRGRVGRGRIQGVACLLTDPDEPLTEAARARLTTLEAFDRLGSGLAISARDLDLRGGGDLVGDDQAGHVRMIGAGLYQRLLKRALRTARGETDADEPQSPDVTIGQSGAIPVDYVPDPVTRIGLYGRLARLTDLSEIDAFEEELEDRFGSLPSAVETLVDGARLQALASAAGARQVRAGPKGVALMLSPRSAATAAERLAKVADAVTREGDKVVVAAPTPGPAERYKLVERLLQALA